VTDDEWARTSIVVFDPTGQAAETVDIPGTTLERQLDAAEVWLRERGSDLVKGEVEEPHLRLFSSWTPADGQHSMTLPPALIEALASVGGVFWMDVYPEHD